MHIDRHTKTLYRTLKYMATPRNSTGFLAGIDADISRRYADPDWKSDPEQLRQVIGSRITVPTRNGKLPKKRLVYCPKVWKEPVASTCMVPTEGDENGGIKDTVSSILFAILANNWLYQLKDHPRHWEHSGDSSFSLKTANAILNAASATELKILELFPWKEGMQDDRTISRFAFAGMAAHALHPVVNDPEHPGEPSTIWMEISGRCCRYCF